MQQLVVFRFLLMILIVPARKRCYCCIKLKKKLQKIEELYMDGVITNGERYNKVISIWGHATADVASSNV